MSEWKEQDVYQGKVLSISSDGQGIIRQNNFVVFVPFTAPEDIILYRILLRKKNFAQGELLEILEPSPKRIQPFCRYYGTCGGCQLQHITYEAQLESKRQIVEDTLTRIGQFLNVEVKPVIPAMRSRAYRRHITLKIVAEDHTLNAGYVSIDNKSLIRVEHCPIFIPEEDSCIQQVQHLIKELSVKNFSNGKVIFFKTENNQLILNFQFEKLENYKNLEEIVRNFLNSSPRFIGIMIQDKEKKHSFGTTQEILHISEMQFACSPNVFTQNHPEQSLKIYQQILEIIHLNCLKILDLYCGIGISSLMLAKGGHEVIGVEYNHESIEFAQENARLNHLKAKFIEGDVEKVLLNKLRNITADAIVINPPRIGVTTKVIDEILKRKPHQIVYISCMPSTLARDLKILCAKDYKLNLIQPYDMFPQTSHVETLVVLNRS